MAQIINVTPHPIHMLDENNRIVYTFPKSHISVRLAVNTVSDEDIEIQDSQYGTPSEVDEQGGYLYSISTSKTVFGEPYGLPLTGYINGEIACYYIVSQLVKSALPERADLLVPAEVVRDTNGNILGCRSLGR